MSKYLTKIKLITKEISNLREIASLIEQDIDALENSGVEENHFLEIQERAFEMINLIANFEKLLQNRVNNMIEDYLDGIYAKISDIEINLEMLRRKQHGSEIYPAEEVEF
jgi:hypothetical protein